MVNYAEFKGELESGNVYLRRNGVTIKQYYTVDELLYCYDYDLNMKYKAPYGIRDLYIDYTLYTECYMISDTKDRSKRYD